MAFGYNGKILKANLNDLTFSVETKDEYFYRTFMGGSAMASFFLLTEMGKGVDALGPDNVLVVTTSILTGTPLPGANRYTVAAKSPLTDGFGESEAGGFFSIELKKSGFDAIVIKGKAPKPVYIWLTGNKAEYKDAADLWGHDSGYAQDKIRESHGDDRIQMICIGQGGENQVRYASIIQNLRHANGRTGMGAVFGSKNLKAIAARGKEKLAFSDPGGLKKLTAYFIENMNEHPVSAILKKGGTFEWDLEDLNADGVLPTRNFQGGSFEGIEHITYEKLTNTVLSGRDTCYACPIRCKQVCTGGKYDIDPKFGGPEYETVGAFGPNIMNEDIEVIAKAHELCNKYSLDTIETGMAISFAMECYENGIISREQTDGLELTFGNGDAALKMIEKIAHKEGFGAVLAEGSWRAARQIGNGAERFVMTVKKQSFAMHEPRGKNNIALAYATSPTGADHIEAAHDMPYEEGRWAVPDVYPIGILKGVPARDLSPKKVSWFVYNQHAYSFLNSLSLCFFTAGPGRLFRLNHVVEMVKSATGWETSLFEIMLLGQRTTTLARMFNVREGFDRKDDELPDRLFEHLKTGPLTGVKLDRDQFKRALDLYYEMMGWDGSTGIPKESKLQHLNIADLTQF
ncbi:MAG: aldehyde ferredoxin oxidoreductase family protein [Deltaproteobacteria bacterium]|nr:aldehyde ferredoxin oxidoreductase family protein [Deltaproteobacteria bacterium]MBW2154073.1 aldehyde ferredoxin oxidoreductase family protein [Deltaproteobacteria bacterium]